MEISTENRICARCSTYVKRSEIKGYSFYCPNCDEDLFTFETDIVKLTNKTETETEDN